MIFRQYEAIIRKLKTETRRTSTNNTYKVNHVYSVVPKRAQPTVYYKWEGFNLKIWHEQFKGTKPDQFGIHSLYTSLKVRILSKFWEPLQSITNQGAIDEGIQVVNDGVYDVYFHDLSDKTFKTPILAYHDLWESINGKSKEYRWDANPLVNVHRFELVTITEPNMQRELI